MKSRDKDWGTRVKDTSLRILPVAVTPVLQKWLPALQLVPLAHWGSFAALPIITYIITTASAAVACLLPASSNKAKALFIIIGAIFLVASFSIYSWISSNPPTRFTHWFYHPLATVSFYATYISYGFVVAHVTKYLTRK